MVHSWNRKLFIIKNNKVDLNALLAHKIMLNEIWSMCRKFLMMNSFLFHECTIVYLTISLHSSGPFPLWGPHHRCHRSCHCSLGQSGTRKPNTHCTAAPAAGSAPPRSESSLEGEQELWEGHRKTLWGRWGWANGQQEWQFCRIASPTKNTQEYSPPQKSSTLTFRCSGSNLNSCLLLSTH